MFVFAVANSQNTHYGLKRVFFGISEIGTPPPILKKGGGCLQRIRYVRHLQPRFLAELDNNMFCSVVLVAGSHYIGRCGGHG